MRAATNSRAEEFDTGREYGGLGLPATTSARIVIARQWIKRNPLA